MGLSAGGEHYTAGRREQCTNYWTQGHIPMTWLRSGRQFRLRLVGEQLGMCAYNLSEIS